MINIFNHRVHSAFYRLALIDAVLFYLAFYFGSYLYFLSEPDSFASYAPRATPHAVFFAVVAVVSMFAMGLYQQSMREGTGGILLRTSGAFVLVVMTTSFEFFLLSDIQLWRGIVFYMIAISFVTSLISRTAFTKIVNMKKFKRQVLVYGTGQAASAIVTAMRRKSDRQSFTIVGFVPVEGEISRVPVELHIDLKIPFVEYIKEACIDQIVIAIDDSSSPLPVDDLIECRVSGIDIVELARFFEIEAGKILVDFVPPGWIVFSQGFNAKSTSMLAKRCFDICASFFLLMGTWPFMLATTIAILIEDGFGAPILFRQSRVGKNGKVFQVLKFRSMSVDAEGDGKARWATKNDSRVTRVGNFIRNVRIDELPQIINVLSGDMAFIGPRPERPEFVKKLAENIPYYDARHGVKPGITGWAQLCYPYGASENDARQKLQFDLYYVKNRSLFLDLLILLNTVEVVLFGKGAR